MRRNINSKLQLRNSYTGAAERTKDEAVMRKEVVASLLFGVIGLLAPFIFVLLLR